MMSVVTEEIKERIRESVADLLGAGSEQLVPIRGMAPHYMSENGDHPENGLVKLFPVEVDGTTYVVYLKQH